MKPFLGLSSFLAAWLLLLTGLRAQPEPAQVNVVPANPASTAAAAPRAPSSPTRLIAASERVAAPDIALDFDVSLAALFAGNPLLSRLNGLARLRVELSASARPGEPGTDRQVFIDCPDARFDRLPLGALSLRVVSLAAHPESELKLVARGPAVAKLELDLSLRLALDFVKAESRWLDGPVLGTLVVDGLDLDRLTDAYPVLAMQGKLNLRARVSGTTSAPVVQSTLEVHDLNYRTEPVGHVKVDWTLQDGLSELALLWGEPTKAVLSARLRAKLKASLELGEFTWLDEEPIELSLNAPELTPTRLRPFWIAPDGFSFLLSLEASMAGRLSELAGRVHARASVKSGRDRAEDFDLELQIGSGEQRLQMSLGQGLVRLAANTQISLTALRRGEARLDDAPLQGAFTSELPLRLVAPFAPSWLSEPRGRLSGRVELAGSLSAPLLTGQLRTTATSVNVLPLSQRLENLELVATFRRGLLEIDRLEGSLGRGRLSGSGWVGLAIPAGADGGLFGGWKLNAGAGVALSRVPILADGIAVGGLSARATLEARASAGEAFVATRLDRARIELSSEPWPAPSAIPTNPGVRVLDWLGRAKPRGSVLSGDGHLRFEFELLSPLTLKAPAANLALTGKLALERNDNIARVEGGLEFTKGGRFELFGTPFVVQNGLLTLLGGDVAAAARAAAGRVGDVTLVDTDSAPIAAPLDVVVDVLAEGQAVETRVATEVRGPLRRPEMLLASSPELPEYQIMTLLITGRVDSIDERNGEVRRAVAALVNQFHNPSLRRQLFDKLGVDKIGFGFGRSVAEPILTVGRQVNRQIYVESVYHHNAPPDVNAREGRVEYRLDPRWTVNTAFGDAAEGRAGVYFRLGFGGPPRPKLGDTLSLFGKSRKATDSDGDALADAKDRCPFEAEDRDGFRDEDGCLDPDNDGDGIVDDRDKAPDAAEVRNDYRDADGEPDVAPERNVWRSGEIRTLSLKRGSTDLSREGQATLDVAERFLRDYPEFGVQITGHSDARGNPTTNRRMSEARALAVVRYLERRGMDKKRLRASGSGSDQPLDSGASEEAYARNRRIEMVLWREEARAP